MYISSNLQKKIYIVILLKKDNEKKKEFEKF